MPFAFTLPTTSATNLDEFFVSTSHPSLILTATTHRSVLRDALKKHKRLTPASQASHLSTVQDAFISYLPFVLLIYESISGQRLSQVERIDLRQTKELLTEWRCTLSSSIPGREPARVKIKGIHNELAFVLQTLAYTSTLQSRTHLLTVYTFTSPSSEQRAAPISTGMKYLLEAQSVHAYVSSLPHIDANPQPADITPSTASALASLALAEATLVVVMKDDPYAAAVAEDRNKQSKDWMISAPSIPKVRAHLFARLCLAAADHAAKAKGLIGGSGSAGKIDDDLIKYTSDFRRMARAKAARFLGIDAEIGGQAGEGIAWLRGAKKELGMSADEDDAGKRKGLKGLKQTWAEKREDRKIEKGGEGWGMDAGRLEEARVIEWLEAKWVKANDMVSYISAAKLCNRLRLTVAQINVQAVPSFEPLIASMPSGREYHSPKPYTPPSLDPDVLARLRAPPDPNERAFTGDEDDSGNEGGTRVDPVGAFPGTSGQYDASNTYY